MDKTTKIMLSLVLAGGISTLIDRLARGFIVDYIDINPMFQFPIFNIADIYIVFGWIILVIHTIKYTRKQIRRQSNA